MDTLINSIFKHAAALAVAVVMVTVPAVSVCAGEAADAIGTQELSDYIDEVMKTDNATGLSMVAVSGDDVAYLNRGYADPSSKTPMTSDTPVMIGSCTKGFTALAVLLLEERGLLSTDDSISDYISWWNVTYQGEAADVKIWHVMNHCAGIPNGPTMSAVEFGTDHSLTEKTARIAENFDLANAPGHISFLSRQVKYQFQAMKGSEGEGHLVTTLSDMSLWLKAQMGLLDLPDDLTNAIAASHVASASHNVLSGDSNYFNGWHIDGNGVMMHTGLNPNYTAAIYIDPVKNIGVVVVCNCVSNAPENVADACFGILEGTSHYQKNEPSSGYTMNLIGTVMSCIFLVVAVLQMILIATQRKKFTKKGLTGKGISTGSVIKAAIFLALFVLSWFLPYGLSALIGYTSFGYKMFYFWGYWSVILMLVMLSVVFLFAFIRSVRGVLLRR